MPRFEPEPTSPSSRISTFGSARQGTPEIDRIDSRRAGRLRCSMLGSNQGELLDISATGGRILLRRNPDLKAGDTVPVELDTLSGSLTVQCSVVWIRLNSERKFEMGIEFLSLTPEARKRLLDTVLHPTRSETLRRGWSVVHDSPDEVEDASESAPGSGSTR